MTLHSDSTIVLITNFPRPKYSFESPLESLNSHAPPLSPVELFYIDSPIHFLPSSQKQKKHVPCSQQKSFLAPFKHPTKRPKETLIFRSPKQLSTGLQTHMESNKLICERELIHLGLGPRSGLITTSCNHVPNPAADFCSKLPFMVFRHLCQTPFRPLPFALKLPRDQRPQRPQTCRCALKQLLRISAAHMLADEAVCVYNFRMLMFSCHHVKAVLRKRSPDLDREIIRGSHRCCDDRCPAILYGLEDFLQSPLAVNEGKAKMFSSLLTDHTAWLETRILQDLVQSAVGCCMSYERHASVAVRDDTPNSLPKP